MSNATSFLITFPNEYGFRLQWIGNKTDKSVNINIKKGEEISFYRTSVVYYYCYTQ